MSGIALLIIFVLAVFVGFEVVSKVSTTLHTPLMSGANAIHGVILVGAIIATGESESTIGLVLGLLAVVLATVNMVGGFVVTDRMLEMFKGRQRPSVGASAAAAASAAASPGASASAGASPGASPGAVAGPDREGGR